ncbi:MAG: RNA-binding protein [Bacteroidetes bacterium]|nr:RNA-binding protein [Bacteroidota bacterium]
MKLFVKNIESSINEAMLEGLFAPFGDIESTKIVYDRITWESKGYGFVEFEKKEDGEKAIEALNGREVRGKALSVAEAEERRK